MSFQVYLDNIQIKTGKTPQELIDIAKSKGFDNPKTKATEVINWLKEDFELGRGHAMAIVYVLKNGNMIGDKHVGSGTSHTDKSNKLKLNKKLVK